MALRNIVKKGDEVLTKKCRVVTDFNPRLHKLLDDMKETLLASGGVGLAAPQVGVLRQAVLVIDTNQEGEPVIELVNPEIIAREGEQEGPEGCLSIPNVWGIVKRPQKVRVRAQDRNGELFEVEGEGLTARAFCHELDHLDGKMYTELVEGELHEAASADEEEEEE